MSANNIITKKKFWWFCSFLIHIHFSSPNLSKSAKDEIGIFFEKPPKFFTLCGNLVFGEVVGNKNVGIAELVWTWFKRRKKSAKHNFREKIIILKICTYVAITNLKEKKLISYYWVFRIFVWLSMTKNPLPSKSSSSMHQLEPVCLIECATIVLAVQTVKASNTRPAGPQINNNNNKTHKNNNKTTAKISLKTVWV